MAEIKKQQQLKQQIVEEIKEKIQKSKSIVLAEFKGMTVLEDTKLRNDFRENDIEYKVYKNTMIKRAFNELNFTEFDESLKGTTAVAFSYKDEVAPAKIVCDNAKDLKNKISAKCGLVSGQYMDNEQIKQLAALPSKEILLAKMLGSLNAPVTNLAGVLSATLRGLVIALKAVQEKKEA